MIHEWHIVGKDIKLHHVDEEEVQKYAQEQNWNIMSARGLEEKIEEGARKNLSPAEPLEEMKKVGGLFAAIVTYFRSQDPQLNNGEKMSFTDVLIFGSKEKEKYIFAINADSVRRAATISIHDKPLVKEIPFFLEKPYKLLLGMECPILDTYEQTLGGFLVYHLFENQLRRS